MARISAQWYTAGEDRGQGSLLGMQAPPLDASVSGSEQWRHGSQNRGRQRGMGHLTKTRAGPRTRNAQLVIWPGVALTASFENVQKILVIGWG